MIKNKEQYLGKYCRITYQKTLIDGSHMVRSFNVDITSIEQLKDDDIISIMILKRSKINEERSTKESSTEL